LNDEGESGFGMPVGVLRGGGSPAFGGTGGGVVAGRDDLATGAATFDESSALAAGTGGGVVAGLDDRATGAATFDESSVFATAGFALCDELETSVPPVDAGTGVASAFVRTGVASAAFAVAVLDALVAVFDVPAGSEPLFDAFGALVAVLDALVAVFDVPAGSEPLFDALVELVELAELFGGSGFAGSGFAGAGGVEPGFGGSGFVALGFAASAGFTAPLRETVFVVTVREPGLAPTGPVVGAAGVLGESSPSVSSIHASSSATAGAAGFAGAAGAAAADVGWLFVERFARPLGDASDFVGAAVLASAPALVGARLTVLAVACGGFAGAAFAAGLTPLESALSLTSFWSAESWTIGVCWSFSHSASSIASISTTASSAGGVSSLRFFVVIASPP
jgi:hypothetical protein